MIVDLQLTSSLLALAPPSQPLPGLGATWALWACGCFMRPTDISHANPAPSQPGSGPGSAANLFPGRQERCPVCNIMLALSLASERALGLVTCVLQYGLLSWLEAETRLELGFWGPRKWTCPFLIPRRPSETDSQEEPRRSAAQRSGFCGRTVSGAGQSGVARTRRSQWGPGRGGPVQPGSQ